MNRTIVLLLGLGMVMLAAATPLVRDEMALRDSLSRVHPRMRASWLRERGLDDSYYTTFHRPESTGLACVGRWPWGPSWELAGRDTFLYLGSGSGVRILSISDSVQPRMLGQIDARSLVSQVVVQDSLLFVACGSWGAQIYSVSDPANPRELSSIEAVIGDLCVKDTFCYAVGGDSLRIYNVAGPSQPSLVGAIRDSGDLVVVANGHAFSAGRWVMNIYNVADPAHPAWTNSRGGPCYAMFVRRNLLFCSSVQPDNMTVLNISHPHNITVVSAVNGYGGDGLFVDDFYAYLPCDYEHSGLFVVDVSDSSHPVLRDSINPEGVTEWEPYVPSRSSYGYLADDYGGLITLDLHSANSISEAWAGYQAHQALDVCVDGSRAYVANQSAGLRILDVSDPTRPQTLGAYDTIGVLDNRSAVAKDSFAFITWGGNNRRFMRVLDATDPTFPVFAAEESCKNPPEDFVLRDSLLYAAEANQFQVFNVARPREPELVGSCVLPGSPSDLCVVDTVAYSSRYILSVARPGNPVMLGLIPSSPGGAIAVRDSFAFAPAQYDSLVIVNVARPSAAFRVASLVLSGGHIWNAGAVLVGDTLLYVGGDIMHVVNVTDACNPREVASWRPPYDIRRVTFSMPYIYAACFDAGVCVLETVAAGLAETPRGTVPTGCLGIAPNPTSTSVLVRWGPTEPRLRRWRLYDAAGRIRQSGKGGNDEKNLEVDLTLLETGVYFLGVQLGSSFVSAKVVRR